MKTCTKCGHESSAHEAARSKDGEITTVTYGACGDTGCECRQFIVDLQIKAGEWEKPAYAKITLCTFKDGDEHPQNIEGQFLDDVKTLFDSEPAAVN